MTLSENHLQEVCWQCPLKPEDKDGSMLVFQKQGGHGNVGGLPLVTSLRSEKKRITITRVDSCIILCMCVFPICVCEPRCHVLQHA